MLTLGVFVGQARHAHLGGVQFVEDDHEGIGVEETVELEESVLEVDTLCTSTAKTINRCNFYMKVEILNCVRYFAPYEIKCV